MRGPSSLPDAYFSLTLSTISWEEFIDEIFSQDEILEMDKRSKDIGKVPSYTSDEILKELGYTDILE